MGYFAKGLTHDFGQKFELSSSPCVVLLKIGLEMMFGDVLERKEAVLHDKKICVLYNRKIRYFPKELTHDFGQKFEHSSLFVFIENTPRNDVWGVF